MAIYAYDAFNRRIVTSVVGGETAFHTYDGWRQVVQYTLQVVSGIYYAAPTKEFVWGSRLDELIAYRRRVWASGSYSWESYYVAHGGQDTAVKLVVATGAVVEQYEYDSYGRVTVYDGSGALVNGGLSSGRGLPFLWKAIRLDYETGLLYMRNRYFCNVRAISISRCPRSLGR